MKGGRSESDDTRKGDSRLAAKKNPRETKRKASGVKDPNKPKRPPTAFFVFMDQFRKEFKAENPSNKLASVVGKAGGTKWKSMNDAEKEPYVIKAERLKEEYLKKMTSYNTQGAEKVNIIEEVSTDKSKSEISEESVLSDEEVEAAA